MRQRLSDPHPVGLKPPADVRIRKRSSLRKRKAESGLRLAKAKLIIKGGILPPLILNIP